MSIKRKKIVLQEILTKYKIDLDLAVGEFAIALQPPLSTAMNCVNEGVPCSTGPTAIEHL